MTKQKEKKVKFKDYVDVVCSICKGRHKHKTTIKELKEKVKK